MRYLHFPEKKYCCKCCSAEAGCGIVKPDWFKTGKFIKEFKKGEISINQWDVQGLASNIYEATNDNEHKPVRIYQEPISDMQFDLQ